jgi:hypothetical protein
MPLHRLTSSTGKSSFAANSKDEHAAWAGTTMSFADGPFMQHNMPGSLSRQRGTS